MTRSDLPSATSPLDARFHEVLQQVLTGELDARRAQLTAIAPEAAGLVDSLRAFLVGGKLLRPRLCFGAARACSTSAEDPEELLALARLGGAIELLQAAALLHDDLIDRSPTRRGRPAVHVEMADRHRAEGLRGEAERFGGAVTIILGDLALSWARDLADLDAGPGSQARMRDARAQFSSLATEVMTGQFLDVLHQEGGFRSPADDEAAALAVIRWKTVSYSVRRPVLMGAAQQGADAAVRERLDAWSESIGTAFQLRDDLLSVVGDEHATGKPTGGDVREGKRTVLLARTRSAASAREDARGLDLLDRVVGREDADDDEIEAVRDLMRSTGAVSSVAADIRALSARAEAVLAGTPGLEEEGREGLARLGRAATELTGLDVGR
ncbi:polyprenyl synthetase family protein [Brachybacterium sp. ACRRE]|uniref:polyprenyl synthetase family protein n=1 Tax=Brachybacterium sp. ACRRE TaxID=2918184 RepID=UPI001EF3576D|nr:polyprenyl synthetase family protein [Brachybacterium sp. ACRRE]MCG7308979.1 polyprenyl synthetase family protein [Brachybacterium sp. ACRRE]